MTSSSMNPSAAPIQQRAEKIASPAAASEAMPPGHRQSAAEGTSLARYGVRAVDTGNETQKIHGEAMYTALTFRRLRSSSSRKPAMHFSLGGSKGGVSLFEKEIPLPCLRPLLAGETFQ